MFLDCVLSSFHLGTAGKAFLIEVIVFEYILLVMLLGFLFCSFDSGTVGKGTFAF